MSSATVYTTESSIIVSSKQWIPREFRKNLNQICILQRMILVLLHTLVLYNIGQAIFKQQTCLWLKWMLYWKHRQKIWTANTSSLRQSRRWAATWTADRMFSWPLCQSVSLIKAPVVKDSLSKLLFKIIWGTMPDLDNSGRPRKTENSTRRFSNESAKLCTR